MTAPEPPPDRLPAALDRATARDTPTRERVGALRELARGLGRRVGSPHGVVDAVSELGPRLAVRDLATLRDHYDGATGRELAEGLISTAAKVSGAIGAAAGVLATATEAAPVALLTAPVQLGVETVAVIAVELKLVAELHAAFGIPLPEDLQQRAALVLRAWTTGRGLNLSDLAAGGGGLGSVLSRAARAKLRERVLRRFVRSSLGFVPLFAGAAAAATANARGTRKLGEGLVGDLAGRHQQRHDGRRFGRRR